MSEMIAIVTIFIAGLFAGTIVNYLANGFVEEKKLSFRAKCKNCGNIFRWHDIIPILSFLLLKGRCRSCGAKVNIRFPLVEFASGVLYCIVYMANGRNLLSILYCLMTSAFLVISIVDFSILEIPFLCNAFVFFLGLIASAYDYKNLLSHFIGAICVSIALYIIYMITNGGLIGGGDVKLMAAAGLLLGWKNVVLAFFLACIIGSVIHLIRMRFFGAGRVLAMGPYLCMGLWICSLWGESLIQWYMNFLTK
jgi:leader peptidase (prepilin peptidase)/N-methyltransferase